VLLHARLPKPLRCEEHHQEPNPAAHHADSGVRADEHERQELILRAKEELVHERAVCNERYSHGDVEHRKAIEEEDTGFLGPRPKP